MFFLFSKWAFSVITILDTFFYTNEAYSAVSSNTRLAQAFSLW